MPDKTKAIFNHCLNVYQAMEAEAVSTDIDNEIFTMYQGHLTKLFSDLDYPVAYYTPVTRELIRMDCIRNYRRGGGSTEAIWLLLKTPTVFDFENMPETVRKMNKREAQEEQRLKNIEERLDRLEKNQ